MVEYQFYLCIILFTRLVYLYRDEATGLWFSASLGLVQALIVLMVFGFSSLTVATLVVVFTLTTLSGAVEKILPVHWCRLVMLGGIAVLPAGLYSVLGGFTLSPMAAGMMDHAGQIVAVVAGPVQLESGRVVSTLMGLLLLANEVNIAMRGIFHSLDLVPRLGESEAGGQPAARDEREYNAGRVIGILERWLMFLVVLFGNNWSALGFIIAAKGLARFDKLKNQTFAEYMLIGTLMSALFAIVVAWSVG